MMASDALDGDDDDGVEPGTEVVVLDEVQPPAARSNSDDEDEENNDDNDNSNHSAGNEVCQAFDAEAGISTSEPDDGGTNDGGRDIFLRCVMTSVCKRTTTSVIIQDLRVF